MDDIFNNRYPTHGVDEAARFGSQSVLFWSVGVAFTCPAFAVPLSVAVKDEEYGWSRYGASAGEFLTFGELYNWASMDDEYWHSGKPELGQVSFYSLIIVVDSHEDVFVLDGADIEDSMCRFTYWVEVG